MLKRLASHGLGVVAILVAGQAFAQALSAPGPTSSAASSGPGSIPVGPLTVYPALDLAHGYDDNLFLRPTNPTSSSFTIVSPSVRAELKTGPHKYDFALRVDNGRFHSSPADSYTDYALNAAAGLVFSARSHLALRAEHRHGHDSRGSTDRGISASPDEYDNTSAGGTFSYGAPGARGRIEVDANAYTRRYTNNRAATAAADRDAATIGGTFYWRVMPRTELLFQAQHTGIKYALSTSTQSSQEDRYLVGVKWEATAKTTGIAKFGVQSKKFDSAAREDISGTSSWDVGIRWSPLTYSVFDFVSSRSTGESTGIGDATVGSTYGVTWSHAWSSRLRTQVLANYGTGQFTGVTGAGRKDHTSVFGLKVAYDFRRWLRLGAEYSHADRDSNDSTFNYRKNLLLFTVGATL